jgi:ferric-dicitrate binding protein FerR (iron transport regulator)
MITDIDNILLIKYLRNELNDTESQQVVDWLQEKKENEQFLFGLKEAYMLSRWEDLRVKAKTAEGWSELNKSLDENQPSFYRKWVRLGLQYAAAAILFLVSGFLLHDLVQKQQPQFNMIETASGQQSTLVLNDGTKVILNENSKLIYPTNFNQGARNVTLQGEAYFEVIHDAKRPFLVNVKSYTVKDLGTKFDVDAYTDDINTYTSLKEGKVQIVENGDGGKVMSELKPGTQLEYNRKTRAYSVKTIDKNAIGDWILSQVVIRHKTLKDVADMLSSKYGYSIKIKNSKIEDLTYNITIEDESLQEILSDIHFITPQVQYSLNKEIKSVIFK